MGRPTELSRGLTHSLVMFRLFVVSYAPLGAIVAVRSSESVCLAAGENCDVSLAGINFWGAVGVTALGLFDAWWLPRQAQRTAAIRLRVIDAQDEGGAVAGYLATYLLPLLGASVMTWRDAISVAIYLLMLLVVFLKSRLALVNPTLYLFGYRVLQVALQGNSSTATGLMLVRSSEVPEPGEQCNVVTFGGFFVQKGDKRA